VTHQNRLGVPPSQFAKESLDSICVMAAPIGEPIFANTVKPRSHTFPMLKRTSDRINVKDSPRDKLRKAFSKKLVLPEETSPDSERRAHSHAEEFLSQMKVGDLKLENQFQSDPLTLNEEEMVEKVVDIMFTKRISCVPVMRGSTLVAIIDIVDIAAYCCAQLKKGTDPGSEILNLKEQFSVMPLRQLLSADNWTSIDTSASVVQLLSSLSNPKCDRIAVKHGTKLVGVLCRREIVNFLHQNKQDVNDKLQLRLSELGIKITADAPPSFNELVCTVFISMWKKQVSGLLGGSNVSSCLGKFLNLIQFVYSVVTESSDLESEDLTTNDTLQEVIEAMSNRNVQTVTVVTEDKQVQYLSFYNILQVFSPIESS